ncbi:beta-lactamase class A [Streptomyces puniciscabiei]|uniref:Beta-lactamase class A n=1 Tax=Streptomyces puniciscabiei TaxID=164348 RepID=A0A542TIA6_9ACTN|nr:serine hydrolase [Streptomyces puniciscabiei]TQK86582.1 beta-lactamase class A [Streptomyces puniciscabiei]
MPSYPFLTFARTRTCALLASAAALVSVGALHPAPAAAAPARAASPRATAAALDLDAAGRTPVVHGEDTAYDTASIVKIDILAALLLQAQDAGRQLTAAERGHAEPMIERSDNTAADALWREIGQASGLAAANKRLGLTSTTGGPGVKWGLTRTTASDQIRMLRAVFDGHATGTSGVTRKSALNARSRTYIRGLMGKVIPEQTWGVSAAGASGSARALKNGWLQRNTTGLWDVNSVGQVTVKGHRRLVAVLSNGSASMSDGISLVERTAREAVA